MNFFSQMLLGNLPNVQTRGRVVNFSAAEIDIKFTTGSMNERVIGYLTSSGSPATAKEIAVGIDSDPGRVMRTLKQLISSGAIECIKHDGCVTEYVLIQPRS